MSKKKLPHFLKRVISLWLLENKITSGGKISHFEIAIKKMRWFEHMSCSKWEKRARIFLVVLKNFSTEYGGVAVKITYHANEVWQMYGLTQCNSSTPNLENWGTKNATWRWQWAQPVMAVVFLPIQPYWLIYYWTFPNAILCFPAYEKN